MIKIITFAVGQASMDWTDNPILKNYSASKVYKPAKDMINEVTEIIADKSVYEWAESLRSYDIPFENALVSFNFNVAYIIFPYWVTELIV